MVVSGHTTLYFVYSFIFSFFFCMRRVPNVTISHALAILIPLIGTFAIFGINMSGSQGQLVRQLMALVVV